MSRSSKAMILRFEENLHHFAGEAAGLGEDRIFRGTWFESILRVHIFDLSGNFRGLFEHGRDRTVFFFREADCILDGLARHFTTDAVDQLDFRVDRGWVGGALGLQRGLRGW